MKRYWKKATALFLTLIMMVATIAIPTGAMDARSSLYLSYYRAWLTPESGAKIDVTIDVQAVDDMDYVGASKVEMFESADGGVTWSRDGTYLKSLHSELVVEDDVLYYDTPISHQGTAGYKYYAIVTVYAEDETGFDSREYQTTTVTARK